MVELSQKCYICCNVLRTSLKYFNFPNCEFLTVTILQKSNNCLREFASGDKEGNNSPGQEVFSTPISHQSQPHHRAGRTSPPAPPTSDPNTGLFIL